MSTQKSTVAVSAAMPVGGVHLKWLLADDPRTINTKHGPRTVIELRDPARLAQALVIWLDGPAGTLSKARPGLHVQLHVESLRPGRERGTLVGVIGRSAVEAAFAHAMGAEA